MKICVVRVVEVGTKDGISLSYVYLFPVSLRVDHE